MADAPAPLPELDLDDAAAIGQLIGSPDKTEFDRYLSPERPQSSSSSSHRHHYDIHFPQTITQHFAQRPNLDGECVYGQAGFPHTREVGGYVFPSNYVDYSSDTYSPQSPERYLPDTDYICQYPKLRYCHPTPLPYDPLYGQYMECAEGVHYYHDPSSNDNGTSSSDDNNTNRYSTHQPHATATLRRSTSMGNLKPKRGRPPKYSNNDERRLAHNESARKSRLKKKQERVLRAGAPRTHVPRATRSFAVRRIPQAYREQTEDEIEQTLRYIPAGLHSAYLSGHYVPHSATFRFEPEVEPEIEKRTVSTLTSAFKSFALHDDAETTATAESDEETEEEEEDWPPVIVQPRRRRNSI